MANIAGFPGGTAAYRLKGPRYDDPAPPDPGGAAARSVREHNGRAGLALEDAVAAAGFFGSEVTHDLAEFKERCALIVVNRWSDELADVADKVYTRDLFHRDERNVRVGFTLQGLACIIMCGSR